MGHSKQGNQSSHRHPRPSRLSYSDSASTAKAQHSKKKSMLLRTPANNPPSKAAWNKMVKLDSLKDLNTAEGQHKFYPEDRVFIVPWMKSYEKHRKDHGTLRPSQYWFAQIVEIRCEEQYQEKGTSTVSAVDSHAKAWILVQWFYSRDHLEQCREISKVKKQQIPLEALGWLELVFSSHQQILDARCIEAPANEELLYFQDKGIEQEAIDRDSWFYRFYWCFRKSRLLWENPSCIAGCTEIYDPKADIQRFCRGCKAWYHISCIPDKLRPVGQYPSAVQEFVDDAAACTNDRTFAQALAIPIERGQRAGSLVGNGGLHGQLADMLTDAKGGEPLDEKWLEYLRPSERLFIEDHHSDHHTYYACPKCDHHWC